MRGLLAGEPTRGDERFYPFPEIQLKPATQQPKMPIWCGGRAPAALDRMGRLADGWISYVVTPDQYAKGLSKIEAGAERVGRELQSFGTAHLLFARVADDYETAFESANAHLKAGFSGSDHTQRREAAQNTAYYIDYLLNGAGTGVPDPHGTISDSPPVTSILDDFTPVLFGGDWNEDEQTNGHRGPTDWLTRAQFNGGARCRQWSGVRGSGHRRSRERNDDAKRR